MAKAKNNDNQESLPAGAKSAAIREMLEKHPDKKVREIVADLGARGISVTANLVYLIKSKERDKRLRGRRNEALARGRKAGVANPAELVRRVKELAWEAGGIGNLKQLVDALAD